MQSTAGLTVPVQVYLNNEKYPDTAPDCTITGAFNNKNKGLAYATTGWQKAKQKTFAFIHF